MKVLTFAAACASVFAATAAHAATCSIGFSQSSVLNAMPASQAAGYASSPWYNAICGGANFVNRFLVDEGGGSIHGIYIIWADDPTVNCFTTTPTWPSGVMGRTQSNGSCVAVNPLLTSRMATGHAPTQWIRIRATNANRWRPTQLKVLGKEVGKVLVEHTDGTFWQYTNLTPGLWNLGSTGKFAKTAWVMNQNTAVIGSVSFDNFIVAHQL
jgi:hypothetical protein